MKLYSSVIIATALIAGAFAILPAYNAYAGHLPLVDSTTIADDSIDDVHVVDDGLDGTSLADALTADSLTSEETDGDLTLSGDGTGIVSITDGLTVSPAGTEAVDIAANANGAVNAVTIGNDNAADTLEVNADTTLDGTLTVSNGGTAITQIELAEIADGNQEWSPDGALTEFTVSLDESNIALNAGSSVFLALNGVTGGVCQVVDVKEADDDIVLDCSIAPADTASLRVLVIN